MSIYLDASVLVASLTPELRTEDAQRLMAAHDPLDIAFSSWTLVEALSGLSKKVRTGHLTGADFEALSRQVRAVPNSYSRTPVTEQHLLSALRLVGARETNLRAGDAPHLAIAKDFSLALATFDEGLRSAAEMVGVPVVRAEA